MTGSRTSIAALLLANGMSAMSLSTVAPVVPELQRAFAGVPWSGPMTDMFLGATALFMAIAGPLTAPLARRIGCHWLLIASLVLFAGSGAAAAVLTSLTAMIASRIVLGVAAAGVMTSSTTLLLDLTPEHERNAMFGWQAASWGFASVAGSVIGGVLADVAWRFAFLPYLVGLPIALMCWISVERPPTNDGAGRHKAIDRNETPAIAAYVLVAALNVLFSLMLLYVPSRLEAIGVSSHASDGLAVGVFLLTGAFSGLLFGAMKKHLSFTMVYVWNFSIGALGTLLLCWSGSLVGVFSSLVVCALGWGLFLPNSTAMLMDRAGPEARVTIAGGLGAAIYLGQFASPLLAGCLVRTVGVSWLFPGVATVLLALTVAFVGAEHLRGRKSRVQADPTTPQLLTDTVGESEATYRSRRR